MVSPSPSRGRFALFALAAAIVCVCFPLAEPALWNADGSLRPKLLIMFDQAVEPVAIFVLALPLGALVDRARPRSVLVLSALLGAVAFVSVDERARVRPARFRGAGGAAAAPQARGLPSGLVGPDRDRTVHPVARLSGTGPGWVWYVLGAAVPATGRLVASVALLSHRQAVTPHRLLGRTGAVLVVLTSVADGVAGLLERPAEGLAELGGVAPAALATLAALAAAVPLLRARRSADHVATRPPIPERAG
ncbi:MULTISPECIES: hypothetical protein [Microbispora]|uniref:hypothetical protein n=1 Tax=Microbispora TaxID=2005 RepID=UPI0011CC79C2|nr:hypothetical protein [Microbispora sp. CSR-4]